MRKLLILASLLFLLSPAAHAQGAAYTAGPFNSSGLLYMCPVPAGGFPCPSPVNIFSDVGLTQPLTDPLPVTALQAVSFYISPGQYTVQMPAAGYNQIVQIGGGGGGGSGTVTQVNTTGPITGGPINTTGTIACATCGVTGSPLSQFASTTSAQFAGVISDETGTGLLVFATSPTLVTPALGTPSSVNLANATFPASIALTANPLSQFAATTSAQFLGVISDETGTGLVVGNNTPTLITPVLGAATGTSLALGTAPAGCGSITGCIAMGEQGTAGTPTAGTDYIRADSVTHTLLCSQNGGAETACVGGGGGSGTVNSGTGGQITWYATTGTAVSGNSRLTDSGTVLAYTGTGGVTAPVAGIGTSPPAITAGTAGLVGASEGTAPTGVSAVDILYGNATNHCADILNQTTDIGCIAGLAATQTFSAPNTFSGAGAASTSGVTFNGTMFTSTGSGTTTFPYIYGNFGTAPTTWSTSGTFLGFNAPSGFAGNVIDVHQNGGASVFKVNSAGSTVTASITNSGALSQQGNLQFGISSHLLDSVTAPVIGTCGTGPSIVANNGTAAFTVNVGTGGTASTCTVTMPAATTGWSCMVAPNGAPQAAAITYSAPTSTTLITLTNYTIATGVALAFPASAVYNVNCVGY
jgi:hypothetical protein